MQNLIIWTSDILGDLVMHGAGLGGSSGQNTVMTYLIRKYVYILVSSNVARMNEAEGTRYE